MKNVKKVPRVKDLFNKIDERYGTRMSEVGLYDFLNLDYSVASIERDSRNRCRLFVKKIGLPLIECKISYNAPLSSISVFCSDFKLD